MRGNFLTDRAGEHNPNYKHGLRYTRLYSIWSNMFTRCQNEHSEHYGRYGGRGIIVCDSWKDFKTFYDWAMSYGYNDNLTLDRIDNDGNYCPENCRWATMKQQCNNTSRCKFITIDSETKTMREWCEITGVNYSTARDRINRGHWDPVKAVTIPPKTKFRRKVIAC